MHHFTKLSMLLTSFPFLSNLEIISSTSMRSILTALSSTLINHITFVCLITDGFFSYQLIRKISDINFFYTLNIHSFLFLSQKKRLHGVLCPEYNLPTTFSFSSLYFSEVWMHFPKREHPTHNQSGRYVVHWTLPLFTFLSSLPSYLSRDADHTG